MHILINPPFSFIYIRYTRAVIVVHRNNKEADGNCTEMKWVFQSIYFLCSSYGKRRWKRIEILLQSAHFLCTVFIWCFDAKNVFYGKSKEASLFLCCLVLFLLVCVCGVCYSLAFVIFFNFKQEVLCGIFVVYIQNKVGSKMTTLQFSLFHYRLLFTRLYVRGPFLRSLSLPLSLYSFISLAFSFIFCCA